MKVMYKAETFKTLSKEEVSYALKMFTPLEMSIVRLLKDAGALNTKQVRDWILDDMISYLLTGHKRFIVETNLLKAMTDKEAREMKKEYDKFNDKKPPFYKLSLFKEKLLLRYGQNPPAYRTVKENLTELESLGFVCKRGLIRKSKENCLWFINPRFCLLLRRITKGDKND